LAIFIAGYSKERHYLAENTLHTTVVVYNYGDKPVEKTLPRA